MKGENKSHKCTVTKLTKKGKPTTHNTTWSISMNSAHQVPYFSAQPFPILVTFSSTFPLHHLA